MKTIYRQFRISICYLWMPLSSNPIGSSAILTTSTPPRNYLTNHIRTFCDVLSDHRVHFCRQKSNHLVEISFHWFSLSLDFQRSVTQPRRPKYLVAQQPRNLHFSNKSTTFFIFLNERTWLEIFCKTVLLHWACKFKTI